MLTDRETELRDAYLKGYDDKTKYNDKLVVDRYELAERYAVNQAKNNEVLDPVSKCCNEHIEERDLYVDPSDGRIFCNQCGKTLNAEIMKMKRDKVKLNVC